MLSDDLFERAKAVSPGGVHSPARSFKGLGRAPIFFKKTQGCYITSVEDKRYIDFCMSFGPLILGHRDPDVSEAVHAMVDTAWTFGTAEPYSLELAEWITSELSWVEKVRFVSSGTEAVMSALRVARAATKRNKILKFEGCYHGHVDSLLVEGGSGLAGVVAASSAGIPVDVSSSTLVCPLDDDETLTHIFMKYGPEIGAVIIEPLPANYGLLPQRIEFLKLISELCGKYGCILIFDEVISGFRIDKGGMAARTGIIPDLVTYGKVIGGGFPVGCYGGRKDLLDLVAPLGPVYQAGTLSGNPIGMRAGLVSLQKMKRLNLWSELEIRTKKFSDILNAGFSKSGISLNCISQGSLFWIHRKPTKLIRRVDQINPEQATIFKKLFLGCLENGLYLAPNAFEVGFVSAAHTDDIQIGRAHV